MRIPASSPRRRRGRGRCASSGARMPTTILYKVQFKLIFRIWHSEKPLRPVAILPSSRLAPACNLRAGSTRYKPTLNFTILTIPHTTSLPSTAGAAVRPARAGARADRILGRRRRPRARAARHGTRGSGGGSRARPRASLRTGLAARASRSSTSSSAVALHTWRARASSS